ncbi:MAG: hypothetical protein NT069_29430, partial [Planctomycetota bacterium]|nr:hypothetical protein [Planctomycetota bacterium]
LATTPHAAPLKDRGAAHAAQRVPVTLAVAGAGLAVGDLNTALAIMRPDYATGPGMAGPLGTVEDVTRALSVGVVVHRGNLLERLRSADTVVLDQSQGGGLTDLPPHVDPNRWQAEDLKWVDRLCRKLGKRVEIEAWFDSKFVRAAHEFHVAGIRVVEAPDEDAARAERLRHLAKEGRRVVYVGDCARFPQTAALAAVAISTSEIHRDNAFEPDAFLLAPELAHVVSLWELAVREPWRHRLHQAVVAVPNVCCVAGAFLLGFTALHAVVLTNLGTAALYGMRDWRLNHARAARRSLGTKLHSEQPHRPQELPPLPPPEGRVPWRQFASGEYSDSATVAPAPTLCENPPQVDFPTSPVGSVTNAPEDSAPEQETLSALKKLPMSVGAILMGVGVVGVLIPGPLGTPLILAGGLALAPRTFSRFEATFRRKYPGIHRTGLKFLGRFVQDFQNRYPDEFQE